MCPSVMMIGDDRWVNLQLVGSEAGPSSLGGFWLVDLLLGGHSPLHVNTVSCKKEQFLILKNIFCFVYECIILENTTDMLIEKYRTCVKPLDPRKEQH